MAKCEVARKVGSAVTPARANKEKSNVSGGEGAGIPAGQEVPADPSGQFWQRARRSGGAGTPAKCPPPGRSRLTTSQNKRRGSAGERRSVPGFRAGEEQGTHNKEHTKRDKENHMSRAGGPQATRRRAVAGPSRPPAGAEKRAPARRDRAGLNPPAARRWRNCPGRPPGQRRGGRPAPTGRCFNQPTAGRWRNRPGRPAAAGGTTPAPLTLPGRRGRWRGNARPGRAAG